MKESPKKSLPTVAGNRWISTAEEESHQMLKKDNAIDRQIKGGEAKEYNFNIQTVDKFVKLCCLYIQTLERNHC